MSSLAIPTHVARQIKAQKATESLTPTSSPLHLAFEGKRERVCEIDTPIPEGLPDPGQWRVLLMPVHQPRTSRGGLLFADETMDVQDWTHQLWKVCKVGPFVYRGPAWAGFTEEELAAQRPGVGDLYLVDPKAPRRFHYTGPEDGAQKTLFIVVNDDQLWSKVDPAYVSGLSFRGLDL